MGMDKNAVSIKTLLDLVSRETEKEVCEKGLNLKTEIDRNAPASIHVNQEKFVQAMSNFIQQAILRTDRGEVILRAIAQDGGVCFAIEDSGRPLDAEMVRKMMNSEISAATWMSQADLREVALPLRMGAKLVSLLGGQVKVESSAGRTVFSFMLSVEAAGQKAEAAAPASQSFPQRKADGSNAESKVLLVDDVAENRALLEVLLRKLGYKCLHSVDGIDAVEKCQADKFALILMDIQMPRMDGFEASRQIRTSGLNQDTPILAMTASGQKGDDLKALDAGCNDCLGKPIHREKLEKKIWRLTAQARQLEDAESGRTIISFLEGDPDYTRAVETFVANLPDKIEQMKEAFERKDLKELAFKAHALKGLGGFAGFPVFTEKAKVLEEKLRTEDLEEIRGQLDELVQLCLRTKLKHTN